MIEFKEFGSLPRITVTTRQNDGMFSSISEVTLNWGGCGPRSIEDAENFIKDLKAAVDYAKTQNEKLK